LEANKKSVSGHKEHTGCCKKIKHEHIIQSGRGLQLVPAMNTFILTAVTRQNKHEKYIKS
jgi:hypothetical protein